MQFALVKGERVSAAPDIEGICPGCSQPVTSKCGEQRIWHWAHLTKRTCDDWWEPETEWHRAWKSHFPTECQEDIKYDDESGEKHIADVRTQHDLVIEFQYSHLNPQERAARERFYGNMVWVVNGTRLKRDYPRFLKEKDRLRPAPKQGFFLLEWPEDCFPAMWLDSAVPVLFDFRDIAQPDSPDGFREPLWCLLPGRAERSAVVAAISRKSFVETASSQPQLLAAHELVSFFGQLIRQQRMAEETAVITRLRSYQQPLRRRRF